MTIDSTLQWYKKLLRSWHNRKRHKLQNKQYIILNPIKNTIWEGADIKRSAEIVRCLRICHTRLTRGIPTAKEEPPACESCGVTLADKRIIAEHRKNQTSRLDHNFSENLIFSPFAETKAKWSDIIDFTRTTESIAKK